jgi:hypothetical protein
MPKSKQKKHNQAVKTTHPKSKHENHPAQSNQVKSARPVKKEHGWLLTTIYVLIILHGIFAAILVTSYTRNDVVIPRPMIIPILTANALLDVVAAVAMWYWKRWGVILLGISAVISSAIGLIATGNVFVIFYMMIPFAILIYIITYQNKKQLFS